MHELFERGPVGVLFGDRMRCGAMGMNLIPTPHLIEREILGFLGKTSDGIDLSYGDLMCGGTPNYIEVGCFLKSFLKIACSEGKLLADAVRDRQSVVVWPSGNLLPQFAQ